MINFETNISFRYSLEASQQYEYITTFTIKAFCLNADLEILEMTKSNFPWLNNSIWTIIFNAFGVQYTCNVQMKSVTPQKRNATGRTN